MKLIQKIIEKKCQLCKKIIYTTIFRIKDGRGKFCSKECFHEAERRFLKYKKIRAIAAKARLGSKATEETKRKQRIARKAYMSKFIGKIIRCKTYNLVYDPYHFSHDYGNYVAQHKYVIEKILNRKLKSTEPVHHLNFKKKDNRIKNLMVLNSNSAHKRMDCGKKVYKNEIVFDGRTYAP